MGFSYPSFTTNAPYSAASSTCSDPTIYAYPSYSSSYIPSIDGSDYSVKQSFQDVDPLGYNMGFAQLSGVDMAPGLAFSDHLPQVNPPYPHVA
jgi:hypothetical protein